MSLYEFGSSSPVLSNDPSGLTVINEGEISRPGDQMPLDQFIQRIKNGKLRELGDRRDPWGGTTGYEDITWVKVPTPPPSKDGNQWKAEVKYEAKTKNIENNQLGNVGVSSGYWDISTVNSKKFQGLGKSAQDQITNLISQFNDSIRDHEKQHRDALMKNLADIVGKGRGCSPEIALAKAEASALAQMIAQGLARDYDRKRISNDQIRNHERSLLRGIYEAVEGTQTWPQ